MSLIHRGVQYTVLISVDSACYSPGGFVKNNEQYGRWTPCVTVIQLQSTPALSPGLSPGLSLPTLINKVA